MNLLRILLSGTLLIALAGCHESDPTKQGPPSAAPSGDAKTNPNEAPSAHVAAETSLTAPSGTIFDAIDNDDLALAQQLIKNHDPSLIEKHSIPPAPNHAAVDKYSPGAYALKMHRPLIARALWPAVGEPGFEAKIGDDNCIFQVFAVALRFQDFDFAEMLLDQNYAWAYRTAGGYGPFTGFDYVLIYTKEYPAAREKLLRKIVDQNKGEMVTTNEFIGCTSFCDHYNSYSELTIANDPLLPELLEKYSAEDVQTIANLRDDELGRGESTVAIEAIDFSLPILTKLLDKGFKPNIDTYEVTLSYDRAPGLHLGALKLLLARYPLDVDTICKYLVPPWPPSLYEPGIKNLLISSLGQTPISYCQKFAHN